MPDGSIVFDARVDKRKLMKQLGEMEAEIHAKESSLNENRKRETAAIKERDRLYRKLEKNRENYAAAQARADSLAGAQQPFIAQLEATRQKITQAKEQVEEYKKAWMSGVLGADIDEAKAKEMLAGLQTKYDGILSKIEKMDPAIMKANADLAAQQAIVDGTERDWSNAKHAARDLHTEISEAEADLLGIKDKAGAVAEKLAQTPKSAKKMKEAMAAAEESAHRFSLRLREVVRSALVFTIITQALAKFREWMGKVVRTNAEASAAMARLRGALLTLAQPLLSVLIPAFTFLLNVLSAVISRVAQLVSAIFGTTAEASANAAESLYQETEALDKTGAAAKKAGKSLASFDEINKLSGGPSDGGGVSAGGGQDMTITPDFTPFDMMDERLKRIADLVLGIGVALLGWKVSDMLPGKLGKIGTKLSGLAVAVMGLILMFDGVKDAWENGLDWGNFIEILAGAAAAVGGLYLAFGKTGAGIGLVVAGLTMLVTGFQDAMKNGWNLQNTLLTLAGIIATGLGISLLTGSLIPAFVAGIAAILLAITILTGNGEELLENLRLAFYGLKEFVSGVFSGDMDKALSGLGKMFKGFAQSLLIILGSVVNLIISGLNFLIRKINNLLADSLLEKGAQMIGISALRIPPIEEYKIPRLAQGAVIPPNREFLAVLGDQKSGTNIETPLPTMIQAFKQAFREVGGTGGGDTTIIMEVDGQQFAKLVYKANKSESRRVGVRLVEV